MLNPDRFDDIEKIVDKANKSKIEKMDIDLLTNTGWAVLIGARDRYAPDDDTPEKSHPTFHYNSDSDRFDVHIPNDITIAALKEAEQPEKLHSYDSFEDLSDETRASIERGLQQAAEGNTVYLGSFAEYADQEEE